jgi:DNA-binding CsgD family transcriptional regulator
MLGESDFLRLTVMVHEAAVAPEVWPELLARYSNAVQASAAFMQRHDFHADRSELLITHGITPRLNDTYNRYYSKLNVWRQRGAHLFLEGRVVADEDLCTRTALKRTEFYNDCLLVHGVTRCLTGIVVRRESHALVFTAMRTEGDASFADEERRVCAFLLPHLIRAHATAERMQMLAAGEAALNALTHGVVLLASDQRVLFANRAADEMLRAGDGLIRRRDRVIATRPPVNAALQRLLQAALAPGESLDCPPAVVVPRASGRRAYQVTATPLLARPAPFGGMPAPVALVIMVDPERKRPVRIDILQHVYKLTRREAMLAAKLADGQVLADAAEQLGMQYETARTHLRRILSKTETSRQAELVLLMERLGRSQL